MKKTMALMVLLAQASATMETQAQASAPATSVLDEQGMYFAKKAYVPVALPTFRQIKSELPQPVYDENPEWLDTYWKAWELAFKHLYKPAPNSGFVSPFFDAAFNANYFLWDGSFITMFTNYAAPMVKGIEGLDNFYRKQYSTGEICREINRKTGKDYREWINKDDRTLYSCWGYGNVKNVSIQYIGREVPKPNPRNTLDALNHPILAWAEWESFQMSGDRARLELVWEPLVRYYMALQKYLRQGNGLYMTDWASMDNSTRNMWLIGGGTGIDISAEMVLFARNLADIAGEIKKPEAQKFYTQEADALSKLINEKMWNDNTGFYFDLNLKNEQCGIKTVAGFWTLIGGVASSQQAEKLKAQLENPNTFGRKYPVPTLAADEKEYSPRGQYWCGAVWAPTNTMVIRGLERYGHNELAYSIAMKHIEQVNLVRKKTGTIWENYAADSADFGLFNGRPISKDFVGWSGIGPIMYLLEFAIGLKPDAAKNTLTWNLRSKKTTGCAKYRFNGHTLDIVAKMDGEKPPVIEINSDGDFTLIVKTNGATIKKTIAKGKNVFSL